MRQNGFFGSSEPHPPPRPDPPGTILAREVRGALVERRDGAWRVLPIEGRFELVYEDGNGAWSVRRLQARELKIGPGRVLVGGTDRDRDGYRGFRADRIHRLTDRDSGEQVERGILDWLVRRAEATRRSRAAALRQADKAGPGGRGGLRGAVPVHHVA